MMYLVHISQILRFIRFQMIEHVQNKPEISHSQTRKESKSMIHLTFKKYNI